MTRCIQAADGLRRAYADEFGVRVNRAVVLLAHRSPADAVRGFAVFLSS